MAKVNPREHIMDSVYQAVGDTPMVRLQRLPKDHGIECEILGKCEFMNPGGSVKDRIGVKMFLAAEKEGRIKPGDTIIEATSGNAGIGLAFVAACKGYKMVVTLPEKMSNEKVSVLKSLGAEIIRTPTEAHTFDENSHYMVARKIQKERPNAHILDQYANPNNPGAHEQTGQEIYDQCEGKIDYIFMGVGTGGTITGVARRIKALNPNIKIIGIDPYGSILAQPDELNTNIKSYHVEGIGYDFIPESLDRSLVDAWVKTDDPDSLKYAREIIAKEGMLCGSSSGSVIEGCFKYLRQHGLDKNPNLRCVVILCDSIRNYLSKFCADDWMVKKGFLEPKVLNVDNHPLHGKTIAQLVDLKPIPHYDDRLTISDCLDAFAKGELAVPLINDGKVKGIVTRQSILNGMMKKNLSNFNSAANAITKEAVIVDYDTDLSCIDNLLKTEEVVFVQKLGENDRIQSLYAVTKLDLIKLVRKETKELL